MITPESNELQQLVQELHQQAVPWLPAGCGSRLQWGPDVQPDPGKGTLQVLSTAALNQILEFSPGDFTVSVQAGTPLETLQAALAEHGQWLALDWPWGTPAQPGGSVGGLVARGLAGGYRQRYLGVRDQLLGIGLLRTDGTAAKAGGKVVKNVAGYDLMRLLCGSWGSLALITEVTLRTMPCPPERRGLWLQGSQPQLGTLTRWLLASSLTPERIDWQRPPHSAPDDAGVVVSLASISSQTLTEQLRCIADEAGDSGVLATPLDAEALEHRLAAGRGGDQAPEADWLLRLAVPASRVEDLLSDPELQPLALTLAAGSGLGMAWAAAATLPAYRVESLRRRCHALGGQLTVLLQPPDCCLPAWLDAPSRPLIEAIKRQYDPKQQLARGRLPGVEKPLRPTDL